jgi:hypothetical protein
LESDIPLESNLGDFVTADHFDHFGSVGLLTAGYEIHFKTRMEKNERE